MRMLHRVQETETLICRGAYQYLQHGQTTGSREQWMITRLSDGTEVVRADVGGETSAAPTLLTHFHRRPDGRPDWLRVRYERAGFGAAAQYNFDEATIKTMSQADGQGRREGKVEIATDYQVDYHPVIAHDFVWRGYPERAEGGPWAIPIFTPDLWAFGAEMLKGKPVRLRVKPLMPETITVPAGEFPSVHYYEVMMEDDLKALCWFNHGGIPLRWFYPNRGFDFVLTEYSEG